MKLSTGYWTFFSKPHPWYADCYLKKYPKEGHHTIRPRRQDDFQRGQLGVLRIGEDTRTLRQRGGRQRLKSGLYAIVEITGPGQRLSPADTDCFPADSAFLQPALRAPLKILCNLIDQPITVPDLKCAAVTDPFLISPTQGIHCMPLEESSFQQICELVGGLESVIANVEVKGPHNTQELQELEAKYQHAAPSVKNIFSKRVERGPIGEAVKKQQNYICAICCQLGLEPHSFATHKGHRYAEAHHVLPVSTGQKGCLSVLNILILCANHHRQMHYGNVQLKSEDAISWTFKIDDEQIILRKAALP